MELIFILTYNCNYRCRYCDIDKRAQDMKGDILEQSLSFLRWIDGVIEKTKFFGGEPTLMLSSIFYAVEELSEFSDTGFYLTTNGSLLTKEILQKMNDAHMRVTLSLDGDEKTTDQNRVLFRSDTSLYRNILERIHGFENTLRVNQVITPLNVDQMVKNFQHLYSLGFREFNFLPEYYVEWSKDSLKRLHIGFCHIAELRDHYPIYLVNQENYSPTSFFNVGIVIDTDGSIYWTNLILAGRFEKYKSILKIGSVFDENFSLPSGEALTGYISMIDECLNREYPMAVMKSVSYVNQILSHFTLSYPKWSPHF